MKPIEAKNQVSLGPGRCLQLALTGMSFRLFRSGITMAILALAVAFLVHMLAYGLITREIQMSAWETLSRSRAMSELIYRLGTPDTRTIILEQLAEGRSERVAEYANWAGLSEAELASVREDAERLAAAANYLRDLPESQQTVLLGDLLPRVALDRLSDEAEYNLFVARLNDVGVPPPLGDEAALRQLVRVDLPRLDAVAQAIRAGHERAIGRVAAAYEGRDPQALAARPPADFVETLRAAGYAIDAAALPDLQALASYVGDRGEMAEFIVKPEPRAAVAREYDIKLSDVTLDFVLRELDSDEEAAWLSGSLVSAGADARLTPERVRAVAERYRREAKLQAALGNFVPSVDAGFMGLSTRAQWLIGLSFIVCVVGVANAMLMSVTERFTEIATMKCLGAMDRFVMMMFVFEAVIQGIVGGILGILLGVLLAILRCLLEFGSLLFEAGTALDDVLIATLFSIVVGVLLAAFAAVGPSWIAARLAPMEAMRVE